MAKQPRTAHFQSNGRGWGCAAVRLTPVLPPAGNKTAGSAVFCSLLSTNLKVFPAGSLPGSSRDSSTAFGAVLALKPFRCWDSSINDGKAVLLQARKAELYGMQVLHTARLDFCRFCKMPAEVGVEAYSGQGRPCCLHKDAKQLPKEGSKCKLIYAKCEN